MNTADVGDARSTTQIVGPLGVRRLTPTELERLQGFPDGHTAQRVGVDGVTKEQGASVRARQLGNAVAVPVVDWILARIIATEDTP
jgi:DNA (cytosine-5)-methyltransferase 1